MDLEKLNGVWADQRRVLKDGLIHGGIWDNHTGLTLSSEGNIEEEFIAFLTDILGGINDTLDSAGFSTLKQYMILNLASENMIVVIIKHSDSIMQMMTLNPSRINLGMLFNVAIPKAIAKVKEANV